MKKWFLRLAPLVLALVMVCGSCLTAFAADSDYSAYLYHIRVYDYSSPDYVYDLYCDDCYVYNDDSGVLCIKTINGLVVKGTAEYSAGGMVLSTVTDSNYAVIVSSNKDILYQDGSLFFRGLPILEPIAKEAGMEKVLEQLMTILPIGLVCLVGWIALRKALAILPRILHQA